MKYTLIFIVGLFTTITRQDKPDLVGNWKWTSYEMNGKTSTVDWEVVLIFNEDGTYRKNCNNRMEPEIRVCETGHWKFIDSKTLHIDRDKQSNGGILYPIVHKIEKFTADSLVIKGKEGPKQDIIVYYIKQK